MPDGSPPLRVVEGGGRPRGRIAPALEFGALGLGLTLTVVAMAQPPGWWIDLGRFQTLYVLAFAFFALALIRIRRYASLPGGAWFVLAVAVATRAALLPVPPSLSDDIHRYVWEGKVIVHGGNPYAQSPADPALAPLRDREIWPAINHPELSTIYPPLAEAGFALVAAISPTVPGFKLWIILHDLALVLVLMAFMRQRGASVIPVIAYAWNPLVLVEYAGSGHNDPTAMVWLAAALVLVKTRPVLSALALSAGVLVKLMPLLALPFLLRRWSWPARFTAFTALGTGLGAFWMLTRVEQSGLQAYWSTWRNNELVFHVLERAFGGFDAARVASLALIAIAAGIALWRSWPAVSASRLVVRVATVVSPVVHPWYLGWVVMFEPFRPSAPWLVLSLMVVLNYGVFVTSAEGRNFHLPVAWRWVEYGVPMVLAGALAIRSRLRSGRSRSRGAPDATE